MVSYEVLGRLIYEVCKHIDEFRCGDDSDELKLFRGLRVFNELSGQGKREVFNQARYVLDEVNIDLASVKTKEEKNRLGAKRHLYSYSKSTLSMLIDSCEQESIAG